MDFMKKNFFFAILIEHILTKRFVLGSFAWISHLTSHFLLTKNCFLFLKLGFEDLARLIKWKLKHFYPNQPAFFKNMWLKLFWLTSQETSKKSQGVVRLIFFEFFIRGDSPKFPHKLRVWASLKFESKVLFSTPAFSLPAAFEMDFRHFFCKSKMDQKKANS